MQTSPSKCHTSCLCSRLRERFGALKSVCERAIEWADVAETCGLIVSSRKMCQQLLLTLSNFHRPVILTFRPQNKVVTGI